MIGEATRRPAAHDMKDALPDGWLKVKLPEIADISMGQSPPGSTYNSHGEGLPFFQGKADFGEHYPTPRVWCTQPRKTANPGDVLISVRAPVGPTNVADQKCIIGRGLAALSPLGGIPSEFLLLALRFQEPQISIGGTGSTFTAISKKDIEGIEISLPPLKELERIVARVEELLARVNLVRERLTKVKEILKRFRQSVLAAAYSGKLNVEKMQFGDNKKRKLKDVVNSIQIGPFGSLLHKSDYVASEIPVINPTNIFDGKIKPSPKVTILKSKERKLERYVLKEGDVIVGRRGEMGRCAVVTKDEDGWICGTGSLFLRPGTELMPHFLQMLISSPQIVAYLEAASVGSTMTNLNQKIFSNMEIPVPAKQVQNQIVRNGQSLFRTSEKIETRCRKADGFLESLEKEVLAKAFRGELVPTEAELARREGRSYETASILLERIRANRAAAAGRSRNSVPKTNGVKQ